MIIFNAIYCDSFIQMQTDKQSWIYDSRVLFHMKIVWKNRVEILVSDGNFFSTFK